MTRATPRPLVTGTDERVIMDALEGLSFPAHSHDVRAYATDRGDVDLHILAALDRLPERVFSSPADVVITIPAP